MVTFMVAPSIGLPLSACSTSAAEDVDNEIRIGRRCLPLGQAAV